MTLRPACPLCFPPKSKTIAKASEQLQGVYCDYSERNGKKYLGFALVTLSGRKSFYSCLAQTSDGEREAVEIAIQCGVPTGNIFCDHLDTVALTGVCYVKRSKNPAHRAARLWAGCSSAQIENALKIALGKKWR